MPWEAWLTLAVTMLVLVGLVRNVASPVAVLFAGLAVLMTATELTGTKHLLDAGEAVAGFGNTGLVTVGLLFIVVAGLVHTGAVTRFTAPLLGRPDRLIVAQLRLLLPVAGLSAFLNNTPIVAMFLPVVDDLCKRSRLPPSRLFLPLSYASIFGGTCTLIGTSTNLVVDGMVRSQAHLPGLSLFDLAWVGVPVAVVGLTYIFLFSPRLLPDSQPAVDADADLRRYTVEVVVEPGGPMAGRTIEAAGLRSLPGLYLSEIDRNGRVIAAVGPREVLQNGDRLVFVGVLDSVVDLHRIRGLTPVTDEARKVEADPSRRTLVEAVVSDECPLVGQSIREGGFRGQYNAAVIAVARGARRLRGKIGDIVLQSGDVLLLETNDDFADRQRNARDFFLVSRVDNSTPRRHHKAAVAVAALLAMVTLAASGILTMLNAALLAAGAMVVTGCATTGEARRSIDWSVLLVIGAALGLGQAMANSGAAAVVADRLIDLGGGQPWLVLLAVFVATSVFTEVITNNAAAVLMFPIALSAAQRLDVSLTPFVITLMIAASASFSTPLGYQTNLMVYGPGGYRFTDYLRFGMPLNVLTAVVTVGLTPLIWPF
ncbi:MAG TPA: SLC13 family permease [Gammaproteobacteria bacterium]|nr:SLC13 family permease [Gammaproteobacteria bacterium]